ncbi:XdhC family protein [Pedobacter sp. AW31-3R]|uniref:XdhC family protein n=1 Tax=Pedobacter sp. AW31-3R TaxID=3445781 RepID=UPI003FA0DF37
MKEISDIICAYETALKEGKRMALATVVHVDGSSYRRPGARMLVTDDGQLTGAISGGCLEGDALRKALLAINQQQNKLVTYDTTNDDDAVFGVQLGCNGIVHILFEPIDPNNATHPVRLLQLLSAKRQESVLVTLFSFQNSVSDVPGTCLLKLSAASEEEMVHYDKENKTSLDLVLQGELLTDVDLAISGRRSSIKKYVINGAEFTAFVAFISPPLSLVIVGAGNDAMPLVDMAMVLGWQVTVADGRVSHATSIRFPQVKQILVAKSDELLSRITIDEQTVFVLMTHNYNYDLAVLAQLVTKEKCRYIGSLGPRKKLERMLADLEEKGLMLTEEQLGKLYGPVGLDLGAETAEEIALSVTAEIKKVMSYRNGASLRDKDEAIHHYGWKNRIAE